MFYDEKGALKAQGKFNNGEKDGKWIWYNKTRKIKEIALYQKGKLEGEYIYKYKNGKT